MVHAVDTAAAERVLNKATAWISPPLRSCAFALTALTLLSVAIYPIVRGAPRGSLGLIGVVISLPYLLVLLWSSWLGYGAGALSWTVVTFVLPKAMGLAQRQSPDPYRFALLLLVSLLISRIAATRRRREAELIRAAEELEQRVKERTAEAVRSAQAAFEAAEGLREQAQLLDLAHDAILSLDWNGTIRFWNRGAESMYGWMREEALGQISHDLLKTQSLEPLDRIRENLGANGHWEGELTHTRKNGSQLRVSSRWAIRKTGDSQPTGYLEINSDITERIRSEEQLRHTQKLESLGVLAGGIAHDFNNLLTGILGNSSLALDTLGPSHPNGALIEEVMKAAERAAELTGQLLAYTGRGALLMRTVDLSELVGEITGLAQTSLPKRAHLRLELADELPGIDADPGQLHQIIMNLVINGAEAIDSNRLSFSPTGFQESGWRLENEAVDPGFACSEIGLGFAARGDILSTRVFEDLLRLLFPISVVAMYRQHDTSPSDSTLVALRLILGHARPDQRAGETADSSAHAYGIDKSPITGPRSYEWTQYWDG